MTATVRRTMVGVFIDGVEDLTTYAVTCSFGFDQRYAEATLRRTGGGTVAVAYWSTVQIGMGTQPGLGGTADWGRFEGYVVPVENALYPIDNVLHCRGRLYRAAWVRNQAPGGTRMADPAAGTPDEAQVKAVLTACGVPYADADIGGTGKTLGLVSVDANQNLAPNPFHWQEGQSGLDYIEQLDAVSVHDDPAVGRYRTVESLTGTVYRVPIATAPGPTPDFTFTEGVDVLEATITRDPTGSANRVTVTGAPDPSNADLMPGPDADPAIAFAATCRFVVTSGFAPYLPAGLPTAPGTVSPEYPEGFPVVGAAFASPMIEKSLRVDPQHPEDTISCQAVADQLLLEYNCVVDTLEFSTPRDDRLGPGQTIHLHSPRLGITDPDQHYWVQHLEVSVDEQGAFTQRLRCLRRS